MHANPFTTPCFGKNDNTIYYIYYSNALSYAGTSKLYSLDLNSREVVLIDENADGSADMKYSQIGNRLVYLTNNPYRGIRVYDATARNFFELGDRIHNECRAIGPHLILNINPQGTIVIAGTDYCNKTNIYSINIENAEYYPICLGTSPALSQDGKTILYVKTLYQ